MVRPRRAKQYLPKEDATPQRDADAPTALWRGLDTPPLPDPRFAGPLGRRSGAPWRCSPCHRSPRYDLRRAPYDHPDFNSNALSEDLFSASLRLIFTLIILFVLPVQPGEV